MKKEKSSIWVEVIYKGDEIFPDFFKWTNEQVADSKIEVLKLQNRQHLKEVLTTNDTTDSLDELNAFDVFDKLLEKASISVEQKEELKESYKEIVDGLNLKESPI